MLPDRLPGGLGSGLHRQNPLQRRPRIGVVADRTLHCRQDVVMVIRLQQQQHASRLVLATPLLVQQSLQEAAGDVAQLGESLAEHRELLAMIAGWTMGRIDSLLSRLTDQPQVPGLWLNPVIVHDHFRLGDPDREQLAHQPPGYGVLVGLVGNQTFRVDDAINDPRRVVVMLGQRQQVRQLLGVRIQRTFLSAAVLPHVSDLGQPPLRHLVQVCQRSKGTTIQEARFHIMKGPFHFTFRLGPPRAAGPGSVAIVGGEREESGVVDRLVTFPASDDHLHVVVQARRRQTLQMAEPVDVLGDRRLEACCLVAYEHLLDRVRKVLDRAKLLQIEGEQRAGHPQMLLRAQELKGWIELTSRVCDTAYRRVMLGEQVPNTEKLFSLFETHTQLYRRGKAGTPNQFGRQLLVFEDQLGFISHYALMPRDAQDKDVIVAHTRQVQSRHHGEIEEASFDRGFYSAENEQQLLEIVSHPCLPPRHPQQYAERLQTASVQFHRSRQRHPGIESAIGALQFGNGLKRCRDRSELGLERYIGLAILGRNLQVLGKLLIARRNSLAQAATTKRKAA